MNRVPDGIPMQEYPPTVKIPPSNANKFLLQTSISQPIYMEYIFSTKKPSTSSSTYIRQRKRNWQQQQDEAPSVPLISDINRPVRIEIIYVDE